MGLRSSLAVGAAILVGALGAGCDTLKSLGLVQSDPVAERGERLRLPPDLSADSINDSMAIPQGGSALAQGPRLGAGLSVQRAGGQRWLTVQAAPEQVWQWLHDYLRQGGIEIANESAQLGVVETGWILRPIAIPRGVFSPEVKPAADARVADHYALRIEPGAAAGSTEVHVAHRRIATERPGPEAEWSLRPSDPFLEAEMLRGFMVYLGQRKQESVQQIAAAEATAPQARLERDAEGRVKLELANGFDDAWRRVGIAIDRLDFTLEDRDRSEGQYFVRYDPEAEGDRQEKGLLASLAFWREDTPDTVPLFVIRLVEAAGHTRIDVTDEAGEPAPAAVSERILALLDEQLRG